MVDRQDRGSGKFSEILVSFSTSISDIEPVTVAGMSSSGSIHTGSGADRLVTSVDLTGASETEVTLISFDNRGGALFTGPMGDSIHASASAYVGDGAFLAPTGIFGGTIETDSGRDTVIGKVTVAGGVGSNLSQPSGLFETEVRTGAGRDKVLGIVEAEVLADATIESSDGIELSDIMTGGGSDVVLGKVVVQGGNDSNLIFSDGIDSSVIDTGAGDDQVIGRAIVSGGPGSALNDCDGIDDTDVITGDGDDLVLGISKLSGEGLIGANGDGFFADQFVGGSGDTVPDDPNYVSTGAGNDRVIGIGADIAIVDESSVIPVEEQSSEGIDGYVVILDDGNDYVRARGASAGVKDVLIEGGAGRDRFDLHSGTGLVDGGTQLDTLILSGDADDYLFTSIVLSTGRIESVDPDGPTDLTVAAIEQFRFDDGLYSFDELFL